MTKYHYKFKNEISSEANDAITDICAKELNIPDSSWLSLSDFDKWCENLGVEIQAYARWDDAYKRNITRYYVCSDDAETVTLFLLKYT